MSFVGIPPSGSRFWGDAVANVAALPASGFTGECRIVLDTDFIYTWTGSAWQLIGNGASGDALATLVAGFTPGSVIFKAASTLSQNNAELFWDYTNNRLGVGTNSPQHLLHVEGDVTYPSGDPSGANATIQYGAASGYPTSLYQFQYRVYAYKNVSGTDYFSEVPATSNTETDDGRIVIGSTPSVLGNINYSGFGYTASGLVTLLQVYLLEAKPQGNIWSLAPGSANVIDDSSFSSYSIDWSWTITADTVDVYIVRNGTDYIQFGSPATNFVDTNSGWSGGASAPSPTQCQDTYDIAVTWSAPPSITPDGYLVTKSDTRNGYTFNAALNVGNVLGFTDNDQAFYLSPVITPTAILGDALIVTGNVGFYGETPTAQYSTTGASGFSSGAGANANDLSTWTGGIGSSAYTVGDIVAALKLIGIMA